MLAKTIYETEDTDRAGIQTLATKTFRQAADIMKQWPPHFLAKLWVYLLNLISKFFHASDQDDQNDHQKTCKLQPCQYVNAKSVK